MNQKEIRYYTPTGFGQYAEGLGTLRASGGDYGGGTEMLIMITECVDYLQIEDKNIAPPVRVGSKPILIDASDYTTNQAKERIKPNESP